MVNIGQLQRAYQNCLYHSCQFLNDLGFWVSANNSVVLKPGRKQSQVRVTLGEPLYFRAWPYRTGLTEQAEQVRSTEQVDILADINETISLSNGRCVHSRLRVNYFRLDGEKRTAVEAVRYDFEEDVKHQHPVCHAQNMNTILDPRPDAFPKNVDVHPIQHRNQSVKIPSAFVNFAGLFVKLTADHLRADAYAEFWTTCKSYIDAIPDHALNDQFDQIFGANSLRSYSWYKR